MLNRTTIERMQRSERSARLRATSSQGFAPAMPTSRSFCGHSWYHRRRTLSICCDDCEHIQNSRHITCSREYTTLTKYRSRRQGHQQQYLTRQRSETRGKREHWMHGMLDQRTIITDAGNFSFNRQAGTEYQGRQISIRSTARCQLNNHGMK